MLARPARREGGILLLKIGVGGSRSGIPEEIVVEYLTPRFREGITLYSGGAIGVDTFAERCWQNLGGRVISLRPVKQGDVWMIERWEMLDSFRVWIDPRGLDFLDFVGAAWYRNVLIAGETDRGVAFWDGQSSGTAWLIDAYTAEQKPCAVHKP